MSERAERDDVTRDLRGSDGVTPRAKPAAKTPAGPNAMTVTDTGSGLGALAATLNAPEESPELVGKSIDRYRVLSQLGAGGMGVVYAALDPALDRKVALKVLPPLSHDREQHLEARLRREAQALARLDHPNVVRVYDVGVAEHSVFVAMQLVEGTTLAELLDEKKPPPAQVLALFVSAARGLAAAHDAGIVHRDVKPSNVLVDRADKVYVGDFGLARGADADDGGAPDTARDPTTTSENLLDESMTREGSVLGTPLYMSPEQHQGLPATPRSDQFSFCVSLWQALFGQHPFVAGRWVMAVAVDAMARDAVREPPSRGVPSRVVRALRRGMRHDPEARWPSMHALIDRLAPRSRAPLVFGGLALAGLAGGVALTLALGVGRGDDPCARAGSSLAGTWGPTAAKLLRDGFVRSGLPYADGLATKVIAKLDAYGDAWSAMRVDACRATRERGEQSDTMLDRRMQCLDGRLAELGSIAKVLGNAPTPGIVDHSLELATNLSPLDDCADLKALADPSHPVLPPAREAELATTEVAIRQLKIQVDADIAKDPIPEADALVATARRLDDPGVLARALLLAADARFDDDDFAHAMPMWRESAAAAARAHDDVDATMAMRDIAQALNNQGKPDQALLAIDDAEVFASHGTISPSLQSDLEVVRASALDELNRFDESDAAYQKALDLDVKAHGPDSFQAAISMLDRTKILNDIGHYDETVALMNKAIPILEKTYGPGHPYVAVALQNQANAYTFLGRNDEARTAITRALAIKRARFPKGASTIAFSLQSLGIVEQEAGNLEAAEAALREALDIRTKALGADHPEALSSAYQLGMIRRMEGHYDDARVLLQHVLDARLQKYGEQHTSVANALGALASLDVDTDNPVRAREEMARSLAIREKLLGPDSDDVAESLLGLASIDADSGHCAQANDELARVAAIQDKHHAEWWDRIMPLGESAMCEERPQQLAVLRAQLEPIVTLAQAGKEVDRRAGSLFALGVVRWKQGERAQGAALVEQAAQLYRDAKQPGPAKQIELWLRAHRADRGR
jgi:serine/threonine-protein kinase